MTAIDKRDDDGQGRCLWSVQVWFKPVEYTIVVAKIYTRYRAAGSCRCGQRVFLSRTGASLRIAANICISLHYRAGNTSTAKEYLFFLLL